MSGPFRAAGDGLTDPSGGVSAERRHTGTRRVRWEL